MGPRLLVPHMKKFLSTSVMLALALSGCEQKQSSAESVPPPEAPALEEKKPEVAATPPPAPPKPAAPEVTPPPARPVVGSIVWAIGRISMMTDDGVIGVPPGARLRVVKQTDTGYVVTDERSEFPVTEAQISMNSGSGAAVAQADAAARQADFAMRQARSAANAEHAKAAVSAQALGELQNRYDLLVREEANLRASIRRGETEENNAYIARANRRVYTRTISDAQIAAWRARLPVVQAEKDKASWDLRRARQ